MAHLMNCKVCGKAHSSDARPCPHCGHRRTSPLVKGVGKFFLVCLVFGFVVAIFAPAPTPPSPGEAKANAERDKRERTAYAGVAALKGAMRNPESFRLESVHVSNAGVACIEYRAQNGFGGMNRESAVLGNGVAAISSDASTHLETTWNRECITEMYDLTNYVQARL